MRSGPFILRGVFAAFALWLVMQWLAIGMPWAGLASWLICAAGAEVMLEASRRAAERRRAPHLPLPGGRRRTDPPARGRVKRSS